jgi:hypothetical protein
MIFNKTLEQFKRKFKWICAPRAEACMEGFGPAILPWRGTKEGEA